ncbi:MAG: tRNA (adenine-N1)-methyltransferase [Acidimicrobiales bacterium]
MSTDPGRTEPGGTEPGRAEPGGTEPSPARGERVGSGQWCAGERALFLDSKGRRYLVTLTAGGRFHTHAGVVEHDEVIGAPAASEVRSATGAVYVVVRPTLADTVLAMPRGAQVVYPKDLGAILVAADIFPGAAVLEAGVGSGALSMALVRAGAEVVGYEVRADFAQRARANVAAFVAGGRAGAWAPSYRVEERDVYEGIEEVGLDRVVLDLPEPWRVLGPAAEAMTPGGILVAYVPGVLQVSALRDALAVPGSPWALAETFEVLHRGWHVEGRSVRPGHRMVAHTGFLTVARLLAGPHPNRSAGP